MFYYCEPPSEPMAGWPMSSCLPQTAHSLYHLWPPSHQCMFCIMHLFFYGVAVYIHIHSCVDHGYDACTGLICLCILFLISGKQSDWHILYSELKRNIRVKDETFYLGGHMHRKHIKCQVPPWMFRITFLIIQCQNISEIMFHRHSALRIFM